MNNVLITPNNKHLELHCMFIVLQNLGNIFSPHHKSANLAELSAKYQIYVFSAQSHKQTKRCDDILRHSMVYRNTRSASLRDQVLMIKSGKLGVMFIA